MLVLHVRLGCGWLSITTPVSLLANDFDVRSILHGQESLAAVSQICVVHEAMNDCKNLRFIKVLLQKCKYNVVYICFVWFVLMLNIPVNNVSVTLGPCLG